MFITENIIQGTSFQRIHKNVDRLVERMKMLEINFNPSGDVFIVFTIAILPNNLSCDLLMHDEING